jgi:hypothetical protein
MINALWRFILTLIFLTSLLLVLLIIWDVPKYLWYELPWDFSKLPTTLLILLAMITGIWWTWSREAQIKTQKEYKPSHYADQVVPKEDIFAVPPPTTGELSMVEQANQANKHL